jgi:16S rRNA (guanine527-N7)-methyltransferase
LLNKILQQGLDHFGLDLSTQTQAQLVQYVELLAKWNKAYNLTAVRNPEQMMARHVVDSLSIEPYITAQRIADIGTGAGLPGIILAIVKPERELFLVDSNSKKTRFLTEVVRQLKLTNVQVHHGRVEDLDVAPFNQITSRAFASIADTVSWSKQSLSPQGELLLMKGELSKAELKGLPEDFCITAKHKIILPLSEDGQISTRHCVIITREKNISAS